jgi:hypothetical protein
MGSSGHSACAQSLSNKSLEALESILVSTLTTLTTLNCRKALLAVIIRANKVPDDSSSGVKPGDADIPMTALLGLIPPFNNSFEAAALGQQGDIKTVEEKSQSLLESLSSISLKGPFSSEATQRASNFCSFLRLVEFRGQLHTFTGLE